MKEITREELDELRAAGARIVRTSPPKAPPPPPPEPKPDPAVTALQKLESALIAALQNRPRPGPPVAWTFEMERDPKTGLLLRIRAIPG